MSYRAEQLILACCLSGLGLCVAALILLRNPASRLSKLVDGNMPPAGGSR